MNFDNSRSNIKAKGAENSLHGLNILNLLQRVKLEEKRERRNTLLVVTLSLSVLIVVGLIITF